MKRLFIYMVVCCMALSAVLLASCERETWYVPEWSIEPGEPIEVLLPIEVPKADSVAVTRGMSEVEEHNIKNLYVLVFTASDGKLYSQQYYDSDRLNEGKTNYSITKDWGSVIDDSKPTNSTNGTIMAKALSETCFIYGIANVTSASSGVDGESTADLETILNNLVTKSEHEADPSKTVTTIDDLYNLVAELKYGTADLMNRDNSNLLMSGVFEMKDGYQTKVGGVDRYTPYQSKYVKGIAGLVDFNYIINTFKDTGDKIVDVKGEGAAAKYYVDLSNAGVIKLRRVASHVIFKISIDDNVFSDFKPESWQVLHVPTKSYLMDQGDETHVVENTFKNGDEVKSMIHAEGTYQFDFYMYENFKNARDITGQTGNFTYYQTNYGNTLEATTKGDEPLPGIKAPKGIYYKNAAIEVWEAKKKTNLSLTLDQAKTNYADEINQLAKQNFTYAKRELALKKADGTFDRNTDNTKNYVYVEPNATTVVFKGRLRFNATNFKLKNLLTGVETSTDNVADSYADVTYTIHLGYAKNTPTDTQYDETDFSILRNTEYTYNVHIAGINNIITNVRANLEKVKNQPENGIYRVKGQPGADGNVYLAMDNIINTDAHFNQFNFMLEKSGLSDFSFEIKTPWSTITSEEVKADIDRVKVAMGLGTIENGVFVPGSGYATGYGAFAGGGYKDQNSYPTAYALYQKYITNPDFTWFKFTPAIDQRGMFDPVLSHDDNNTKYRKYRETVTYDPSSPTLWNLFDFMVSMDGLTASDDQQPLYNEGINQGTDTVEEYRRKIGTAIKTRINNVLYGNDAGTTEGSVTLFECEVNDDKGNNVYTGASALPFLLDKFKYEVTQQDYNFIKTIYDAVTADNSITINDDIYFNNFKRPYIEDGRYWVEEDYVQYLKEHDPAHFGNNNQIAPIRRMFYTAYLDEYFYDTPPRGQSWSTPYWKQFVNQPSRYISFGYRGTSTIASSHGIDVSWDGESSIMYSSTTIIQPSIQTFYSTEGTGTYALGVEHYNETYDPRWTDKLHNIGTSGWSHADGWDNAKKAILDVTGGGNWAAYVSETVYEEHNSINGIQSNVTMRSSDDALMTDDDRMGNVNKTAYLAGAIRMYINRNRDENGNGVIDHDELKWYLPASEQMDIISLCHYSLTDPLFNFNKFYDNSVPDAVNHQRLPESNLLGKYLYKYHFATSDHFVFGAEEFMNSAPYSQATDKYNSPPYDMRCVRNLNDATANKAASKNVETPSDQELVKVYTYDATDKVFTMNKLDSRSLRNEIYVMHELPAPHYLFSRDNLPYKKFKVAKDNAKLLAIVKPPYMTTAERGPLKNIILKSPCANYTQDPGDVNGSWRAPNAAELGLMMMQLRASGAAETEGYYQDTYGENGKAAFFWDDGSATPFCGTSWNFTGPWGRVLGVKNKNGKWKVFFSDPAGIDTNSEWPNKSATEEFMEPGKDGTRNSQFIVRCVKDLAE